MDALPDVATLAGLIGDATRSSMLDALMGGRALTAKELAYYGGVTPQTASSHLGKLTRGGLIRLEQHGRNRYYRLGGVQVAEALEAMMVLAARHKPTRPRASQALEDLRAARTCYDHLAGSLGVALTTAMIDRGFMTPEGRDFGVSEAGFTFLAKLGVEVGAVHRQRRAFARQCLDWTERRLHLAGALGAALASRYLELHWIVRMDEGRAVQVSPEGRRGFAATFGIEVGTEAGTDAGV